jgi:hypothetical protein
MIAPLAAADLKCTVMEYQRFPSVMLTVAVCPGSAAILAASCVGGVPALPRVHAEQLCLVEALVLG